MGYKVSASSCATFKKDRKFLPVASALRYLETLESPAEFWSFSNFTLKALKIWTVGFLRALISSLILIFVLKTIIAQAQCATFVGPGAYHTQESLHTVKYLLSK